MAALVLLFVFAGCSQPSDFTFKQTPNALPAPEFEVTAYEGLILLRWKPVTDAASYEVYRYDTVAKVTTQLSVPSGQLYYTDWVSWSNQLQDKVDYEYTVVAVSKASTPRDGAYEGTVAFLNGVAKKTIRANIPANLTVTLDDFTYEELDTGTVLVKIPNKVNQSYKVAYTLGKDNPVFVRELTDWTNNQLNTTGNWYDPIIIANISPVGAENTIVVQAQFGDGLGYYTTAKAEKTVVVTELAGLLAVSGFQAQRDSTLEKVVGFTWTSDAEDFTIYKAELDRANYSGDSKANGGWKTIALKSDWVEVDLGDDGYVLDNGTWGAAEVVDSVLGDYIYGIVARAGEKVSAPQFSVIDDATIIVDPDLIVDYKTNIDGAKLETAGGFVGQIYWNKDNGTIDDGVYTLTENDGTTTTDITLDAYDYMGYNMVERTLAKGKTYNYELTISKNGAKDTKKFTLKGPSVPTINGFSLFTATGTTLTTNAAANSIVVTLSTSDKLETAHSVELYRRVIGQVLVDGGETQYPIDYQQATQIPGFNDGNIPLGFLSKFDKVTLSATQSAVPIGTDSGDWTFVDVLTGNINNVYQYVLVLDGKIGGSGPGINNPWGITSGTVASGYTTLGWRASWSPSATVVNATATAVAATAASGAVNAYSIVVATGQIRTGYQENLFGNNSGYNISGLPVKVDFTAKDGSSIEKHETTIVQTIGTNTNTPAVVGPPAVPAYDTKPVTYLITLPGSATANDKTFGFDSGATITVYLPQSASGIPVTLP